MVQRQQQERREPVVLPEVVVGPGPAFVLDQTLREGIPEDHRGNEAAARMVAVLPAVAGILDEALTHEAPGQVLDPTSPGHPSRYREIGLSEDDYAALWDLYKARWESPDVETRRVWLRKGWRQVAPLTQNWATNRFVVREHRATVRQNIGRLIRTRRARIQADTGTFAVLSRGGEPLEEPHITTAPARRTRRRGGGGRGRHLTPEQTGELTAVDPDAAITAEEIEQARREIEIEVVSQRMVQFVNTDVLAPMPVASGNQRNIRTHAFSRLIGLLQEQRDLEAELGVARGLAPEGTAEQPVDPRLQSLRERIEAEAARASETARAWYQQQDERIEEDVGPSAPVARPGRRLGRASLRRSYRAGVRRYYIRRALSALDEGRLLVDYQQVYYRGRVAGATLDLEPARLGHKVDRPSGHLGGGPGYNPAMLEEQVRNHSDIPDEHRTTATHILLALARLEGAPQSLNTWDSALLTLGSGLAARGVLQQTLAEFKEQDATSFRALFGRFGIDVTRGRGGIGISVRVGSSSTDPRFPPGETLTGEPAVEYLATDPVLMVQLRRAGHAAAWQRFLIDGALGSVVSALAFPFAGHRWPELLPGVPSALAQGSIFAIANQIHGAGNHDSITAALAGAHLEDVYGMTFEGLRVDGESAALRQAMALTAAEAAARNRRRAFGRVVPEFETELESAREAHRAARAAHQERAPATHLPEGGS